MKIKDITAVIVSYNQEYLLRDSYRSLRQFYPEMPVVIVDGSPANSDCWKYARYLMNKENTVSECVEYNIGHGKGMNLGIELSQTDYVLLFDSDVIVLKSDGVELMLQNFVNQQVYGVGQIVSTNKSGKNIKSSKDAVQYLHPHFALINKKQYQKYPKFSHHGAPLIKTMIKIQEEQKSILINFPVSDYIYHKGGETRKLNPKEFCSLNWEITNFYEFLKNILKRVFLLKK